MKLREVNDDMCQADIHLKLEFRPFASLDDSITFFICDASN